MVKKGGFIAVAFLLTRLISSTPALAYSGSSAAAYADQWALSYNPNYPNFSSTDGDCTNFVSQSVQHGNYTEVDLDGVLTNDANWFCWDTSGNFTNTHSWSVVGDFRTHFLNYTSSINEGNTLPGYITDPYPPNWGNPVGPGDVVFYDWYGNGLWDHATILVGSGEDPNPLALGATGALVDAHTDAHYHAIWTLEPYNANWATTIYDTVHIE